MGRRALPPQAAPGARAPRRPRARAVPARRVRDGSRSGGPAAGPGAPRPRVRLPAGRRGARSSTTASSFTACATTARLTKDYRNRRSPFTGANAGKWPIRYDPDDVSRVFFQDPETNDWHTLVWAHHSEIDVPFSAEALAYARRLARKTAPVPRRPPRARRAAGTLGRRPDAQPDRAADGAAAVAATQRPAHGRRRRSRDRDGSGERPRRQRAGPPTPPTTERAARGISPRTLAGDDDDPDELDALPADELDDATTTTRRSGGFS